MGFLQSLPKGANKEVVSDFKMFMLMVGSGELEHFSSVHRFGRNEDVNGTLAPIADGGAYRTPTAVVTLACISDDADDTAAGAGAQEITLEYLDVNFAVQTATIETNGITESTQTVTGVLRLLGAYVSRSGAYADQATPSQQGTITIRVAGAGQIWSVIPELGVSGMGTGKALIGAYTVPAGKTAYILSATMSVDSNKTADLYFSKRNNADDIVTPFSGIWTMDHVYIGVIGTVPVDHGALEAIPEKTDIGFLGTAATSADVSVGFELLLVDN